MVHALAAVASSVDPPPCEVWLAATIDEEHSFRGVTKLCEDLTAHAAVVAEPTDLRAVIASKGVLRWRIRTVGRAAHSSKPHLGVNAITAMSHLVLVLAEENQRLSGVAHPLLGPATNNVGIIRGGRQINFVPDECSIEIDRRLIPGEEIPKVLARYQEIIDETAKRFPGFQAEMEPPMLEDYPLETPPDATVMKAAKRVLERHAINPEPIGVPYGSDASKFSRKGIPSIVLGPGSIDQAHAAVEYVDCSQVEKAVEIYRGIMETFE
jgi:acetylornithine deacetylase